MLIAMRVLVYFRSCEFVFGFSYRRLDPCTLSHPSTHLRSSSQDKINGMNAAVLEQMSLPKHKRKREYRMATMDDIELEKIWNLVGTLSASVSNVQYLTFC